MSDKVSECAEGWIACEANPCPRHIEYWERYNNQTPGVPAALPSEPAAPQEVVAPEPLIVQLRGYENAWKMVTEALGLPEGSQDVLGEIRRLRAAPAFQPGVFDSGMSGYVRAKPPEPAAKPEPLRIANRYIKWLKENPDESYGFKYQKLVDILTEVEERSGQGQPFMSAEEFGHSGDWPVYRWPQGSAVFKFAEAYADARDKHNKK